MAGATNPNVLTFTAPTKYDDGSTIPAGGIAKYQYGFGTAPGVYSLLVDDTDFAPNSGKQVGTVPLAQLGEGQKYAAARAVSVGGGVAAWSNEVPFFVQRIPAAITDLGLSG